MEVNELFDRIEEKVKVLEEKEKCYVTKDSKWCVILLYFESALMFHWEVSIYYRHPISKRWVKLAEKPFRKYEDALKFYEECVEELKRRYEE